MSMTDSPAESGARPTAVRVLAAVGFIALIAGSFWFAVYSTRFVPNVVGRLGGAAVYIGSVFSPAKGPSLAVVPAETASTTISFGEVSSTSSTSAISTVASSSIPAISVPAKPAPAKPTATSAGPKTISTVQISGTRASPVETGLPDLVVTITGIGYLAAASADSLVTSSTVPPLNRPAVTFTIKNIGTATSGPWRFSASIPTQTAYIYESQPQQPLAPGDSIDYTLGFDQSNKGAGEMISITANFDHTVRESNPDNNSASATVTVLGS